MCKYEDVKMRGLMGKCANMQMCKLLDFKL
ncbi:MAG: hypothetical protein JWP78_3185 [Mucilaginibacter sp.]|nr:hypothetical protein [Mucilaginibacter sp.]